MAGLLNKIMNFAGIEVQSNEDDEIYGQSIEPGIPSRANTKVLSIHNSSQMNLIITSPAGFDEACDVIDNLKLRKSVIMNLEKLDVQESRRMIDFLSGAIYAIDGNIQKITTGIFLVAPFNVNITGDFKDEFTNKGIFNKIMDQ